MWNLLFMGKSGATGSLFLFFVHYCFTSNCFSLDHQERKPARSFCCFWNVVMHLERDAWDAAGLTACRMHFSTVWGKLCSLKGKATPIHIISLSPQLSTISSFWTEGNQGSCRAKWDFCTPLALKAKLWPSELVGGDRKKRAPRTWLTFSQALGK